MNDETSEPLVGSQNCPFCGQQMMRRPALANEDFDRQLLPNDEMGNLECGNPDCPNYRGGDSPR